MVKAILFDLWGTLVEQGVRSPLKQVLDILDIRMPFSEYVERMERAMMTRPFENLTAAFSAVCKEFGLSCRQQQLERCVGMWNTSWMLAQLYPETIEVLQELGREHRLILVSNTDPISVQKVLEKHHLKPLFHAIYLSCETGMLKTDRGFLSRIMEENSLAPEDCIIVGDSIQSDMLPAQKAGIRAVLMDRRDARDFQPKIKNLRELKAKI